MVIQQFLLVYVITKCSSESSSFSDFEVVVSAQVTERTVSLKCDMKTSVIRTGNSV